MYHITCTCHISYCTFHITFEHTFAYVYRVYIVHIYLTAFWGHVTRHTSILYMWYICLTLFGFGIYLCIFRFIMLIFIFYMWYVSLTVFWRHVTRHMSRHTHVKMFLIYRNHTWTLTLGISYFRLLTFHISYNTYISYYILVCK